MLGQYPSYFGAAVVRNPVINAGEMVASTDIPDWCYSEFGLAFNPAGQRLDAATYDYLYSRSPIASAHRVVAPVMLLLGEQDQRVPPSQGRNFYHFLKGKGNVVDMLCFPGNGHGLDKVEAMRVSFEVVRDWFNTACRR